MRGSARRRRLSAAALSAVALCVLTAYAARAGRVADAREKATQDKSAAQGGRATDADAPVRPPTANVKPFDEALLLGVDLYDKGKIGPDTRAEVTAKAELDGDGGFKPDSLKLDCVTNHEDAAGLASRVIIALGQSRAFSLFKGAREVALNFKLDAGSVSARVTADVPSEAEARRLAEGYATLLTAGRIVKKGTREGELYAAMSFTSEGRSVTFAFDMPRDAFGSLLSDMAKRASAAQAAR